jgi:hypothetical protein
MVDDLGDALSGCERLRELRLNDNDLRALPDALRANQGLRILDLGTNPIRKFTDLKASSLLPLVLPEKRRTFWTWPCLMSADWSAPLVWLSAHAAHAARSTCRFRRMLPEGRWPCCRF